VTRSRLRSGGQRPVTDPRIRGVVFVCHGVPRHAVFACNERTVRRSERFIDSHGAAPRLTSTGRSYPIDWIFVKNLAFLESNVSARVGALWIRARRVHSVGVSAIHARTRTTCIVCGKESASE
jgi:hypothetical protein